MTGNHTGDRNAVPPQPRHFHVAAEEMLFNEPKACPFCKDLTLDGIAVQRTPGRDDRLYLIVRTSTTRAYLGPNSASAVRRATIITEAIRDHPATSISQDRSSDVLMWIAVCWQSAQEIRAELGGGPKWPTLDN